MHAWVAFSWRWQTPDIAASAILRATSQSTRSREIRPAAVTGEPTEIPQIAKGRIAAHIRRVNTLIEMFTGIVGQLGEVALVERRPGSLRLRIDAGPIGDSLAVGDSVAVNGACLTAVDVGPGRFAADVVDETVDRTTLGSSAAR